MMKREVEILPFFILYMKSICFSYLLKITFLILSFLRVNFLNMNRPQFLVREATLEDAADIGTVQTKAWKTTYAGIVHAAENYYIKQRRLKFKKWDSIK